MSQMGRHMVWAVFGGMASSSSEPWPWQWALTYLTYLFDTSIFMGDVFRSDQAVSLVTFDQSSLR